MTDGDLRDGSSETQRVVGRRASVWGSTHQLLIMFITRHLKIRTLRLVEIDVLLDQNRNK